LLCSCYGKVAKGGMQGIRVGLSQGSRVCLTGALRRSLIFFLKVLRRLEPRSIPVSPSRHDHVVLYSDAAWESIDDLSTCGLGAVILGDGVRAAAAALPPASFFDSLSPRRTQIIPLELLAAIAAVYTFCRSLKGREAILFIDNESVASALVSGASIAEDLQELVCFFHFLCSSLHCGVWIEWVPSHANAADEPSRSGTSPLCPCRELRIPEGALRHQAFFDNFLD
jgi:hypothetical protein